MHLLIGLVHVVPVRSQVAFVRCAQASDDGVRAWALGALLAQLRSARQLRRLQLTFGTFGSWLLRLLVPALHIGRRGADLYGAL
jgi:hypothetical protein